MTNSRPFLSCILPLLCIVPSLRSPAASPRHHRDFPLHVMIKKGTLRTRFSFILFPHPAITLHVLVQILLVQFSHWRNVFQCLFFFYIYQGYVTLSLLPEHNLFELFHAWIFRRQFRCTDKRLMYNVGATILLENDTRRFARFHKFNVPLSLSSRV